MNGAQVAFAVFALLVVCSLVAASLGTVAVEVLLQDDDGGDLDPEEFDASVQEFIAEQREEVERNPNDAQAMASLAELLASDNQLDEAIDWYQRALEIEPNNTSIRLSFAKALAAGAKRADAEVQYKKVIELEPNNYEAHYYLAELYRLWEPPRLDEAAAEYRRVLEIVSPADAFLARQAADVLTALGYATPAPAGTPAVGTPEQATPASMATPATGGSG